MPDESTTVPPDPERPSAETADVPEEYLSVLGEYDEDLRRGQAPSPDPRPARRLAGGAGRRPHGGAPPPARPLPRPPRGRRRPAGGARLRAARRGRPRRDGHRLPGPAAEPEPRRRPEDDPGRGLGRAGAAR